MLLQAYRPYPMVKVKRLVCRCSIRIATAVASGSAQRSKAQPQVVQRTPSIGSASSLCVHVQIFALAHSQTHTRARTNRSLSHTVHCVDSSVPALSLAERNGHLNGVADKLTFVKADVAEFLEKSNSDGLQWDCIVRFLFFVPSAARTRVAGWTR
jgi:hypothetical protein